MMAAPITRRMIFICLARIWILALKGTGDLKVALTTTLVTFILPESYSSTVRIAIEKEAGDIAPLDGQRTTAGYDPYWIQDQYEKIQSKSVLYPVITNKDLMLHQKWAAKYKEE